MRFPAATVEKPVRRLQVIVSGGHFVVYTGPGFDTATAETIAWLKAHLA